MNDQRSSAEKLMKQIDELFIDCVGPIGQMLAEDARQLWRRNQWKGPSAFRNYIKVLASNIDSPSDKERFSKQTNQLLLDAVTKSQSR